MESYNNEYIGKEMHLVIFRDALDHILRLSWIVSFPKGHAMLVGYGGSGKKSIAKLCCFI